MAIVNINQKNENAKELPVPKKRELGQGLQPLESEVPGSQEQPVELGREKKVIHQEIQNKMVRVEIEKIDLDDKLKVQVQAKANDLQAKDTQAIVNDLLGAAKSKGVIFAVHVAQKLNDPYILDVFHDALAKEGYYKEFLK